MPFGKLLRVLREKDGESSGRVHFHFLLAGLDRRDANPYIGCDRFGRTVDMKWQTSDRAAMLDRVLHGYDRASYG